MLLSGLAHWLRLRIFAFAGFALVLFALPAHAENTATEVFDDLSQMVFQVRVIDLASGDKFSIGSGFQVAESGLIATNFHVVSSYVHEPEKFRLEVVLDEKPRPAQLLRVDVIHDLAILSAEGLDAGHLELALEPLRQGSRLYSMGNPQDLGMTIIEGTYNGLVRNSRYQKILFSGSLNPGMSGGPAVNSVGEVVGVNVSKGGEQISFLVPVANLVLLLDQAVSEGPSATLLEDMGEALLKDQDAFYKPLLQRDFELEEFGELLLPGKVDDSLRCWGHTVDSEDILYDSFHQHCRGEDDIFVGSDLFLGDFFYDYEWMNAGDLNRFQFYTALQTRFTQGDLGNDYVQDKMSEQECVTDRVMLDERVWKVSSCMRSYFQYPGLYDATLLLALVDRNDRAAVIRIGASGISQGNATELFRKTMEAVKWKH